MEGTQSIKRVVTCNAIPVDIVDHSQARKKAKNHQPTMFEFCSSKESTLGYVNADREINHFRLSKDITDLTNPQYIESLKKLVKRFPGCDLWGLLPCDPWSKWQSVNVARYGKSLCKEVEKETGLVKSFAQTTFLWGCGDCAKSRGHIAFEWPKGAKGWLLPELVAFMKRHKLFMAECHGCFFGMQSSKGRPMFKPWHIATSSYRLASQPG